MNWPDCLLPDIMHQIYIGEITRNFEKFVPFLNSVLKPGDRSLFWSHLSAELGRLCRLNNLERSSEFKDLASWKALKAVVHKDFLRFGVELFEAVKSKVLVIQQNDDLLHKIDLLKQLCKIATVLSGPWLERSRLNQLQAEIDTYVKEACSTYEDYCSINTHQLSHWREVILQYGLPRSYWTMPFEYNMRWFKEFMNNINFCSSHLTIASNALDYLSADFMTELKNPGEVITPLFQMEDRASKPTDIPELVYVKVNKVVFRGRKLRVRTYQKPGSFIMFGENQIGEVVATFRETVSGKPVLGIAVYEVNPENDFEINFLPLQVKQEPYNLPGSSSLEVSMGMILLIKKLIIELIQLNLATETVPIFFLIIIDMMRFFLDQDMLMYPKQSLLVELRHHAMGHSSVTRRCTMTPTRQIRQLYIKVVN